VAVPQVAAQNVADVHDTASMSPSGTPSGAASVCQSAPLQTSRAALDSTTQNVGDPQDTARRLVESGTRPGLTSCQAPPLSQKARRSVPTARQFVALGHETAYRDPVGTCTVAGIGDNDQDGLVGAAIAADIPPNPSKLPAPTTMLNSKIRSLTTAAIQPGFGATG
jgi:hypothetical protein